MLERWHVISPAVIRSLQSVQMHHPEPTVSTGLPAPAHSPDKEILFHILSCLLRYRTCRVDSLSYAFILIYRSVIFNNTENQSCMFFVFQRHTRWLRLHPASDFFGLQARHLPARGILLSWQIIVSILLLSVFVSQLFSPRQAADSGSEQGSGQRGECRELRKHAPHTRTCVCFHEWTCFDEHPPEPDDGSCQRRARPHGVPPL